MAYFRDNRSAGHVSDVGLTDSFSKDGRLSGSTVFVALKDALKRVGLSEGTVLLLSRWADEV